MILIHSADPRLLARLCATLSSDLKVRGLARWDDFVHEVVAAVCCVIAAECLERHLLAPKLRAFAALHPEHSLLLVTQLNAQNARLLTGLRVDEVIWLAKVEQALPAAVHRVCGTNQLVALCSLFAAAIRLPPTLREGLSLACRGERPVHSVQRLADILGCDRRIPSQQWKAAVDPACELRLEDVLDWLLLLRAVNSKAPSRSWESVAREMGTCRKSLTRYARRLMGCELTILDSPQSRQIAEEHFRLEMECVLGSAPATADNLS